MSTPDNDRVMWSGLNDIANEGTYVGALLYFMILFISVVARSTDVNT